MSKMSHNRFEKRYFRLIPQAKKSYCFDFLQNRLFILYKITFTFQRLVPLWLYEKALTVKFVALSDDILIYAILDQWVFVLDQWWLDTVRKACWGELSVRGQL